MSTAIDRLMEQAALAGCASDQIENFIRGGYVPLPWQLRFHAAARECDLPGGPDQVGAGGSRGPGKSHAILAQMGLDDCQRFPGIKCLYVRRIAKQASEQFDDLRRKVFWRTEHTYRVARGILDFPNSSRIVTGHFKDEKDLENYLGIEYDIVAVEEATTLSGAKYQGLRDSNRSSRAGFRPRIYNSTNPGGIGHTWYKERFVEPARMGEEKWTRFIPATLDDNWFLDEDYRRKVEENVGWKLRAYRWGDWDVAVGQFFTNWDHRVHVIDHLEIGPDWPIWAGFDYGFVHPTAVIFFTMDGDGNVYAFAEHRLSRASVGVHVKRMGDILADLRIDMIRVWPWAAGSDVFARRGDSSGKTIAEQYADYGVHFRPADVDRVNGWAECLRRLGDLDGDPPVQPRFFVHRRCKHLIATIPALQHDEHRAEDVLKWDADEDGKGGDDPADAWRYGLMAKNVGAVASEVIPARDPMERYDTVGWGGDLPDHVSAVSADYEGDDYWQERRGIYRV